MSIATDRLACLSDFGVTATINGVAVRVIHDNEFLAQLDVESSNPVALARSSDMTGVLHGASISIPAGDFSESFTGTVIELHPDGTGFTAIELERI